jgi:hypothetical protein
LDASGTFCSLSALFQIRCYNGGVKDGGIMKFEIVALAMLIAVSVADRAWILFRADRTIMRERVRQI